MTDDAWAALSARQRDALVAERIMGWTNVQPYNWTTTGTPPGSRRQCGIPEYTNEDHPAWARAVEDQIEARGLIAPYMEALVDVLGYTSKPIDILSMIWMFMRATPDQRCLAALRAVGDKGG